MVQLSNDDITLDDEANINRHFQSIDYYNSYIATHPPRAIDYFGRAMDFIVLRDYSSAVADLTRALELTPDFALGYFQRSNARYNQSSRAMWPMELQGKPRCVRSSPILTRR